MVKTFIQTIDTQRWLRFCRQFIASLLIFSLLAIDVAKAMNEEDRDRLSHKAPPLFTDDKDMSEEEVSTPPLELNGDLPKKPPLENPHIRRVSSHSALPVGTNEQNSNTPSAPDLTPRQAYSADSQLPRPFQDQISSPLPTINPVLERREEITQPIQPPPLLFSRSNQPNPLSVDPKPKEESLLQTLFSEQSVLLQLSPQHHSPSPFISTIVPSPLPVTDDPLQRSDKPSSLLFSGDTDDEEDAFDDDNLPVITSITPLTIFDSNAPVSDPSQNSNLRDRSLSQPPSRNSGKPTEITPLIPPRSSPSGSQTFSVNGEELEAMVRQFVPLEDFDQAPDVRNPPPPPSLWGKIKKWGQDRTWLPKPPTYTLASTTTPWRQAFRPQDRGDSDEEEIGDPRHLSPPVDPRFDDSDDAQREDSDSSGNSSPEKKSPSVLLILGCVHLSKD